MEYPGPKIILMSIKLKELDQDIYRETPQESQVFGGKKIRSKFRYP